ncbi:MAG: SCO1664 family protein [Acidimicrobiales bacterium]
MLFDEATLELLRGGEIEILGRMPWSSNGTFLVQLEAPSASGRAVYKPRKGERPLWDFPSGLYKREVAAYELSRALGWEVIPPTVLRDGPLGVGSVQAFVDAEFEQHYFTLQENPAHRADLERICVFDLIANNTDRKSGHCLLGKDGRIYGIDNGLAFHEEFKLRTVIWDFGGESIPQALLDDVAALAECGVPAALGELLDRAEQAALLARARRVLRDEVFPIDETGRRYPWPLV